jgi:hypothetical protein
VQRLDARYDNLIWMKLSEIARYWAAKELTRIEHAGGNVTLRGPFACPDFTVDVSIPPGHRPVVTAGEQPVEMTEVKRRIDLKPGTFVREGERAVVCFDLPQRERVTVSSMTADKLKRTSTRSRCGAWTTLGAPVADSNHCAFAETYGWNVPPPQV